MRTPEITTYLELPPVKRWAQRTSHTFSKGYRERVPSNYDMHLKTQSTELMKNRDIFCGFENSDSDLRWGPEHVSFFFY